MKGLSPRHMDPKYASVEDCEKVWGVRCANSHGFKYKKECTYVKVIYHIAKLWPKVYQSLSLLIMK